MTEPERGKKVILGSVPHLYYCWISEWWLWLV